MRNPVVAKNTKHWLKNASYPPKNASHRTENCKSSTKKIIQVIGIKMPVIGPLNIGNFLYFFAKKQLVRSLYFRSQVTPDQKKTYFGILETMASYEARWVHFDHNFHSFLQIRKKITFEQKLKVILITTSSLLFTVASSIII